ncbi:MAG: spore coat U domain-containing protein [Acidobacteriota bacterium]
MKAIAGRLLFVAFGLSFASSAYAGKCSWSTAPPAADAGSYSVFSPAPLDGVTSFTIRCNPNTTGTIKLSVGSSSTSYTPRTLAQGALKLPYNAYLDAAATLIWGDGTSGTTAYEVYNGEPHDKVFTDQIYIRVPAVADASAGVYEDTITATLSWGNNQSDTVTFKVRATVIPECTATTTDLNFGAYDPLVINAITPKDSSSAVTVYCTKGVASILTMGGGANASGAVRRMRTGVNGYLSYEIYKDGARSIIWNATNTNSATSTSKSTPLGGGAFTAFGRIPAGQDPVPGNYADVMTVTVNY